MVLYQVWSVAISGYKKMLALWGPTKAEVFRLDFELRKVREFQNSPRGVMAEAITPPALLPTFFAPRD